MPVLTELEIVNMALAQVGSKALSAISEKSDISLQQLADLTRDEVLGMYDWKFARKRKRISAAGILDCSALVITFVVNSGADTVTDSTSTFVSSGAEDGDRLKPSDTSSNDATYDIADAAAGTLTLETYEDVTAEVLTNDADLKLYFSPASNWLYKYAKPSGFLRLLSINDYKSNDNIWDIEGDFIVTNDIDTNDQIVMRYIESITDESLWPDLFVNVYVYKLAAKLVRPLEKDLKNEVALEAKASQTLFDGLASMVGEVQLTDERDNTSWQNAGL